MDKRVALLGVVATSFAFALPALAGEVTKSLDVRQGFFFQAGAQAPVGCVRAMKLGTSELDADLDTTLPTTPGVSVKCVAVLSDFTWSTSALAPITLGGRLSVKNKQTLAGLVAQGKVLDTTLQLAIYEYDQLAKRYFLGVRSSGADLKGTLDPASVGVDANTAVDVSAPQNHAVTLSVKPRPVAQAIRLGSSASQSVSKPWGVAK